MASAVSPEFVVGGYAPLGPLREEGRHEYHQRGPLLRREVILGSTVAIAPADEA